MKIEYDAVRDLRYLWFSLPTDHCLLTSEALTSAALPRSCLRTYVPHYCWSWCPWPLGERTRKSGLLPPRRTKGY